MGPWVSIGKGTLSCVLGRADAVADLVPVDVCINMMVAAAWDVHANAPADVTVLNCVTGASNPVTWGDSTALWVERARRRPYASTVRTARASFTTSHAAYQLRTLTGQLLPAHVVDAAAMVTAGTSPRCASA